VCNNIENWSINTGCSFIHNTALTSWIFWVWTDVSELIYKGTVYCHLSHLSISSIISSVEQVSQACTVSSHNTVLINLFINFLCSIPVLILLSCISPAEVCSVFEIFLLSHICGLLVHVKVSSWRGWGEILRDLYVLSPSEYEKVAFGKLSVCTYVCMDMCLASASVVGQILFTFNT
jgi:hypothetical protein